MPGYPSLMVGMMTIGGVQLLMIGIVGEYIGKILSELKAWPIYFVAEHSEKRADGETRADATERTAANEHAAPPRRIWLCADDYGISASVDRAIRDLLAGPNQRHLGDGGRRRDQRAEVASLKADAGKPRFGIGLHVTLTAPF